MQVVTTGNSLRKTGAKIQRLRNALRRSLAHFNQNYLIHCIGIDGNGITGNYDVKSRVQNAVSSG
jgi:hypothetical protein